MTVREINDNPVASFTQLLLRPNTLASIQKYGQLILENHRNTANIHSQLRSIDLSYMREEDLTEQHLAAQRANRTGDSSKIQNLTVPIVMPQVEAGVAHLHAQFLTGSPIFPVVADPQYMEQANQLEAVIAENATYKGWVNQLTMAFRDGLKYNFMPVCTDWEIDTSYVLTQDIAFDSGRTGKPKEVVWEGNALKRLDPYNTIFDNRCNPSELHIEGEYAGYLEIKNRIKTKEFINSLGSRSIQSRLAFETPNNNGGLYGYYVPQLNSAALYTQQAGISGQAGFNWLAWANNTDPHEQTRINYTNTYEFFHLYARIIPRDFDLRVPERNTPQIWKFVFVNGVLVFGERKTNAHNILPIVIGQPLNDGLGSQTKSFASNIRCFQDLASALWNAKLSSERRKVTDRMFYDPTRIRKEDINNPAANAKIPVRAGAFGKGIADAFAVVPFRDESAQSLIPEATAVTEMANTASGLNRPQQGQFQRGNKTREEYVDTMENSGQRINLISVALESQFFAPLKKIILYNTLQFQQAAEVTYNKGTQQQAVVVDPADLRMNASKFTLADGVNPVSKIINMPFMREYLQMYAQTPQLQMEFDIVGFMDYLAQVNGAANVLKSFRRTPEMQQQMAMNQMAARQGAGVGSPEGMGPNEMAAMAAQMQGKQ